MMVTRGSLHPTTLTHSTGGSVSDISLPGPKSESREEVPDMGDSTGVNGEDVYLCPHKYKCLGFPYVSCTL